MLFLLAIFYYYKSNIAKIGRKLDSAVTILLISFCCYMVMIAHHLKRAVYLFIMSIMCIMYIIDITYKMHIIWLSLC